MNRHFINSSYTLRCIDSANDPEFTAIFGKTAGNLSKTQCRVIQLMLNLVRVCSILSYRFRKFSKKRKLNVVFFLFFLMFRFIPGSSAIMCYHCNSAYDPRCADPFNAFSIGMINCSVQPQTEHQKNLDLPSTLCRKTTQKGKRKLLTIC